jgi:hypothetical protein
VSDDGDGPSLSSRFRTMSAAWSALAADGSHGGGEQILMEKSLSSSRAPGEPLSWTSSRNARHRAMSSEASLSEAACWTTHLADVPDSLRRRISTTRLPRE